MPATRAAGPGSSRIGREFTKRRRRLADPIHKDTAETLLRKLIEQNDPRYAPAGYILAVMLERKRVLKVKEQIVSDGKRVFIYEQPGTGDVFTIADPDLRLDQLEAVQRDVAALLEHGLNPPAPAPVAAAEAATEPRRKISRLHEVENIEHSTFNIEHRTARRPETSAFSVRCSMFDVPRIVHVRTFRIPNPPRLHVPRRGPAAAGADASVGRA